VAVSEPSVPTTIDLNTRRSYPAHASFVIAMIMPISTNTMIAIWVQIHVGDTRKRVLRGILRTAPER
jgi:hypothetical protein